MNQTPNLATEFHPQPKPSKKERKEIKPISAGKKTIAWNDNRVVVKKQFEVWGIYTCEIKIPSRCKSTNFLSFAHKKRRRKLTEDDIKNPRELVLGCTSCHDFVDFTMDREEGERFLENIIATREKYLKEHGML